jgi:hypothetical protein
VDTVNDTPPRQNLTNRQVEDAAIAFVVEWETAHGRPARDTRGRGAAGDVAGQTRTIEVKTYGRSSRGQHLWLEVRQVEEAARNPDFWLYLVENVRQGDPSHYQLLQIGGEALRLLLSRAVERRYSTVPWPVAVYDSLISDQHQPPASTLDPAQPMPPNTSDPGEDGAPGTQAARRDSS